MKSAILPFLLLGCLATWAQPAMHKVSTPEDAAAALEQAVPGTVVALADGVYTDAVIRFSATGREDQPVRFQPQTPGGVTFTGTSRIIISGEYVVVSGFAFDQAWGSNLVTFDGASNCTLQDCAFVECGSPTSSYPHIITLYGGSRENSVEHCYMRGNLSIGMGVRIRPNDFSNLYNRFSHNHFRDIERRSSNGQEAIQIGQGGFSDRVAQYATVEYCLFENASGDAEIISNKSSSNTYRFNTFRNCRAMLVLRGGSRATVDGNVFIGNSGGIRVHNGFHTIVNNYIQDCAGDGIYMPSGARHYGPVNYCVVAHNTIINCGRYGIYIGQPNTHPSTTWTLVPAFNDILNNVIIGDRGTLIRDDGSHVTTWRGNVVWPRDDAEVGFDTEGVRRVDPGLVRAADGLWHPQPKSVLLDPPSANYRDVEQPIPGLTHDAFGRRRDGNPDLGAEEVTPGPLPRPPLTPRDVGPRWMQGDEAKIRRIDAPKPIPPIRSSTAPKRRAQNPAPVTPKAGEDDTRTLQAEDFELFAGAETVSLPEGGTGVRLGKSDAQAEASVVLPVGTWIVQLYLFAEDSARDAVYLYAGTKHLRTYPQELGKVSPAISTLLLEVTSEKPVSMIMVPGENGVCIDRIELSPK